MPNFHVLSVPTWVLSIYPSFHPQVMLISLTVNSKLAISVNVSPSLCVSHAIDWQPVKVVPYLSLFDSWESNLDRSPHREDIQPSYGQDWLQMLISWF